MWESRTVDGEMAEWWVRGPTPGPVFAPTRVGSGPVVLTHESGGGSVTGGRGTGVGVLGTDLDQDGRGPSTVGSNRGTVTSHHGCRS